MKVPKVIGQRASALLSAVTCHRFFRFGDSSPQQRRTERRDESPDSSASRETPALQRSTATSRLPKAVTSHRTPKLARNPNALLHRQKSSSTFT
jgi:hypothetical protein